MLIKWWAWKHMKKILQRNAILKYFVDADDVCYISVCIGKAYCPHLKGAHVSVATYSPASVFHPFHRGLHGGGN
jgi:hypothetical protein